MRRLFPDGTWGDIHFHLYNTPAGYTRENTPNFPYAQKSSDAAFVAACDAFLQDGAILRQMYEEQRFDAELFPDKSGKALSFYTISEQEMMDVYKHGLTSFSRDNGITWSPLASNPTLRTSTGKVWSQRTSDGRFALMYNPTTDGQHRWPIAIATGDDGHIFKARPSCRTNGISTPPLWAKVRMDGGALQFSDTEPYDRARLNG